VISAYKSPRDKLACVLRCCETIEHLTVLARGTTSADDILPVLVFVLLKVLSIFWCFLFDEKPQNILNKFKLLNKFRAIKFSLKLKFDI
jgi:hypothetical protein